MLSCMKLVWCSFFLAFCFSESLLASSNVDKWTLIGTGYKPGTDQVLFYEYSEFELDSLGFIIQRRVEYRLPDGSLKSVKVVDYDAEPAWTPSFTYEDYQLNSTVGVLHDGNDAKLFRRLDDSLQEQGIELIYENTVIDAGFDAYIQFVWPRLLNNEVVAFDVLSPLKFSRYAFELKMKEPSENLCFIEMSLDWWPISLFIDPVQLTYDCATKKLLRYQGLTNLRDSDNNQYRADIHYQWLKEYPPFRLPRN